MAFFRYILSCIRKSIKFFFISLIKGYQYFISPLTGPRCRFCPTCSNYAIEAIKCHGIIIGLWLMIKRLLKCHPYHVGGCDPVPPKIKKVNQNHEG